MTFQTLLSAHFHFKDNPSYVPNTDIRVVKLLLCAYYYYYYYYFIYLNSLSLLLLLLLLLEMYGEPITITITSQTLTITITITRKYYPSSKQFRDPPTYTHQPSMQQKVPFSLIRCSSSKVAFCSCVE